MGKANTVNLYGRIVSKVEYRINPETMKFSSAKFILMVSRRQFAREDVMSGDAFLSTAIIVGRDEKIIDSMIGTEKGDMVLVKGNLSTRESNRVIFCKKEDCDYREVIGRSITIYIDPVSVLKVGHIDNTEEEPNKAEKILLNNLSEISNQVIVEGRLCRDVDYYEDPGKRFRKSEYQIAVPRLRRIKQDEKERTTDYPWVVSFGKMAKENKEALHKNSLITINGALMTRAFNDKHICKLCGAEITEHRFVTKIVPYNVEYREDYIKPESTHKATEGTDEEDEQSVGQTEPAE